jgi:hypothetical protein
MAFPALALGHPMSPDIASQTRDCSRCRTVARREWFPPIGSFTARWLPLLLLTVNFAKRLFTSEELVETFHFILGTYSSFAAVTRMYGSGPPVATRDPSSSHARYQASISHKPRQKALLGGHCSRKPDYRRLLAPSVKLTSPSLPRRPRRRPPGWARSPPWG